MRPILFIIYFLCLSFILFAQQTLPTNNLLLGYQEFPTIITSHAADASGNQYYTGMFRGELKINNQKLATGQGLEDIFWVKTNANGQVQRFKTFGSANSEFGSSRTLAVGNSKTVFSFNTYEAIQLGSVTVTPYQTANGSFAGVIVCTDTAGTVQWAHRTNLQNLRIFFANNVFHAIGQIPNTAPATKLGDQTILDSLGLSGFVHLMLSENGSLLGVKSMTGRRPGQSVSLFNLSSFSDKTLFIQLRASGDTSFLVNQTPVSLPTGAIGYEILMRIDTAYRNFRVKNLNPLRQNIAGWLGQATQAAISGDSIYHVVTLESGATPYQIDGFSQQHFQNNLIVLDSTLTVRRQVNLGNSRIGTHSNSVRRRVFFRYVFVQNGQLYLNGVYTGINESPLNAIQTRDTTFNLLPGLPVTINQNGPSQSFMARCNTNGLSGSVRWYGEHTPYESFNVSPIFLHSAGNNRLAFIQNADNVWNPWVFDENLNILSGSMQKAADLPENTQMINFFPDGSRVVMGYARGKTALDNNGTFISNSGRRDAFIARLRPNNQVVWYKRFHSTLTAAQAHGLEVRNGKAFFLFNYNGTQNDSNYIRVENSLYPVGVNASLLGSIDTSGNLTVLNLNTPILRVAMLMNFSFFNNDDLAVVTTNNPVAYNSFPLAFSPQIFRVHSTTGAILDGRKLVGNGIGLNTIRIDKNDQLYLSGSIVYPTGQILYLYNGGTTIDTLNLGSSTQTQSVLLKMSWNDLQWAKRFTGGGFVRQIGDMTLSSDKPVFGIQSPMNSQPLLWEGQTVHNGFPSQTFTLVKINPDGSLGEKKAINNFSGIYLRSGSKGRVYVSGLSRSAIQIDTIQVGFAGGLTDAVGLAFDSTMIAKQSFRVGSPYVETMNDFHVYNDSLMGLAYTSQSNAQVYLNRTTVNAGDYEEDAYVGSAIIKSNTVTSINTPLPPATYIRIAPNPIVNGTVMLSAQVTEPLRSLVTIYHANGQLITSNSVLLTPGSNRYSVTLPPAADKGVYRMVVSNKKWTTTQSFLVL